MARNRMIKPDFWTSEDIIELEPIERLFFIGFWNFCDDSGVLPDKPKKLKCMIFPADNIDCLTITNNLVTCGLLVRYMYSNDSYLRVKNWNKHQKIKHPSYKYPLENGEIPVHVRYKSGTCTDSVRPKEKEKEKEKEKVITCFDFESFWNQYEKKGNRKTSEARYSKIKENERELIKSKLPLYIQSTPNKQYRKNAEVWLNQDCWNDEVSNSQSEMDFVPIENYR